MPRCQWCRQESEDLNVCDWCKRPLAAGWTPAAAPADRMTFSAPDDEPNSDRLLMFSMVGIVSVVGLAFAFSMFTRKQPLPTVQPTAPPIVQQLAPQPKQPVEIQSPVPAPLVPGPEPQIVAQPNFQNSYIPPPPPP